MTQRRKFLAAALGALGLAKVPAAAEGQASAGIPAAEGGPDLLFTMRDTVVAFNPGTGLGTHLGTAAGRINGVSITNFQFTPVSQTEITFDNRVLITDLDGDQILFRQTGSGRFITSLSDSSINGDVGAAGGPLSGNYECLQANGKWGFLVGRKFSQKSLAMNSVRGLLGAVYIEVYDDRFSAPPV